jgi:hypothetical protein
MPTVADLLKFRDKFSRLPATMRNIVITDTIAWLESEERAKCKPEHLSLLVDFENELQSHLNQSKIPEAWFLKVAQTYGSCGFWERFLRRVS